MKLKCTMCQKPVDKNAYVAWQQDKAGVIKTFGLYCVRHSTDGKTPLGCYSRRGFHRYDLRTELHLLDGPLSWFIGPKRAFQQLLNLMWNYRWEQNSDALRACLEFFATSASEKPFGKGAIRL